MQDFLILISRDEFIRLYKFGNIFISKAWIAVDDERVEEQLNCMLNKIFMDDEREYLLLKLRDEISNFYGHKDHNISIIYNVEIAKVQRTIVFSQRAHDFYKTKVNTKVHYEVLPLKYTEVFSKIKDIYITNDMKKGALAALEIFGYNTKLNLDKIVDEYMHSHEGNFSPSLENELYLDLLLYKREDKFPLNEKSFLYDVAILSLLRLKHEEDMYYGFYKEGVLSDKMFKASNENTLKVISEFENENLFELILELDKSANEKLQKFKLILMDNSIKQYVVCAIFFKLVFEKNSEKNILDVKMTEKFKLQYPQEVAIAVYLFGMKYGYENLYDDLYETKNINLLNPVSINREEDLDNNILKNRIEELESKLREYELHKKPISILETTDEIITQSNNKELKQVEISEEGNTTDSINDEKSIVVEEVEPIESFLNSLGQDALIDIWSSAGSKNKKDLQDESEEDLIKKIIINESSCSGVKELLQTFHKDTLASVLYKLNKKNKTKGILQKDLKNMNKEELILKLLAAYKSYSSNIISKEME